MHRLLPCGLMLLILGSGPSGAPDAGSTHDGPADRFEALEDRLLHADSLRLVFQVTAEGAVGADLKGLLEVRPDSEVVLSASGEFAGQPADLLLRSTGDQLELANGSNRATAPRPERLREAVLVGLTRMGVLHNLARLTGTAPPDHADGGVRDWVTVGSFSVDPDDSAAVRFDLTVAGHPSGSASLEIDTRGLPVLRRQIVKFPSGEMRVVERYSEVTIEP